MSVIQFTINSLEYARIISLLCYTCTFFTNLLKAMITYIMYELSYYNPKILHLYSSGCFGLLFFRAISWPLSFWIIIQLLNFIVFFEIVLAFLKLFWWLLFTWNGTSTTKGPFHMELCSLNARPIGGELFVLQCNKN